MNQQVMEMMDRARELHKQNIDIKRQLSEALQNIIEKDSIIGFCQEETLSVKKQLSDSEMRVSNLNQQIIEQNRHNLELETKLQLQLFETDKNKQELQILQLAYSELVEKDQSTIKQGMEVQAQYVSSQANERHLANQILQLNSQISTYKQQLQSNKQNIEKQRQSFLTQLSQLQTENLNLQQQLSETQLRQQQKNLEIQEINNQLVKFQPELKQQIQSSNEAENQIEKYTGCPNCQHLKQEQQMMVSTFRVMKEKLESELDQQDQVIQDQEQKISNLLQQVQQVEMSKATLLVKYKKDQQEVIQDSQSRVEEISQLSRQNGQFQYDVQKLTQQVAENRQKLSAVTEVCSQQITVIKKLEGDNQLLKLQIKQLKDDAGAKELEFERQLMKLQSISQLEQNAGKQRFEQLQQQLKETENLVKEGEQVQMQLRNKVVDFESANQSNLLIIEKLNDYVVKLQLQTTVQAKNQATASNFGESPLVSLMNTEKILDQPVSRPPPPPEDM